ncbi:MAG TPA: alpha/beta hydrolase [Candidatus Binataceae bacterium]|nr:alpha/beta hydrolase [Candidatus Binataceae bacterium]
MASGNGSGEWREETVRVDDSDLKVVKGGSGKPLLVLHEELGWPGWLKWNAALAQKHGLLIPQHPGYTHTLRAEWISNIRDMAGFYARYLTEQNLAPVDAIGFSLGGWIAAEMAANNPGLFRKLVLVAPMGIRPREGAILDFFQLMAPKHLYATVFDPDATPEFDELYGGQGPAQFERWEEARAQSARLAWVPFMHNPSLPHLLGVAANLPTLLLWGKEDKVVPLSAADEFKRVMKAARLVVFEKCGHRPEVEKSADFLREVETFLA